MRRITSAELLRSFGQYSDAALAEPVIVTKNGRDRLVLMSIEQYNVFQHALDGYEDAQAEGRRKRAKPQRNATFRRAG